MRCRKLERKMFFFLYLPLDDTWRLPHPPTSLQSPRKLRPWRCYKWRDRLSWNILEYPGISWNILNVGNAGSAAARCDAAAPGDVPPARSVASRGFTHYYAYNGSRGACRRCKGTCTRICYLHFDLSGFPVRSERLDELQRCGSVVVLVHGHVQFGHYRSTLRDVDVVRHGLGMKRLSRARLRYIFFFSRFKSDSAAAVVSV